MNEEGISFSTEAWLSPAHAKYDSELVRRWAGGLDEHGQPPITARDFAILLSILKEISEALKETKLQTKHSIDQYELGKIIGYFSGRIYKEEFIKEAYYVIHDHSVDLISFIEGDIPIGGNEDKLIDIKFELTDRFPNGMRNVFFNWFDLKKGVTSEIVSAEEHVSRIK